MASPTVNIGSGTSIAGNDYTGELLNVSWSGISRPAIKTTHMSTTAAAQNFGEDTYIPGDFADPGELTLELNFNPDSTPPVQQADVAATITVTWNGGATWACDGFMTGFELNCPMEEKMTCSATYKLTGDVTIVAG